MFIDKNGNFYFGDLQSGDREATQAEVEVFAAAQTKALVLSKLSKVREVREAMLNRMAGIAFAAQIAGTDPTIAPAYIVARAALLDITTGCPTDPAQVDTFIQTKYAAIVAALPPSLLKAFAGVDA